MHDTVSTNLTLSLERPRTRKSFGELTTAIDTLGIKPDLYLTLAVTHTCTVVDRIELPCLSPLFPHHNPYCRYLSAERIAAQQHLQVPSTTRNDVWHKPASRADR